MEQAEAMWRRVLDNGDNFKALSIMEEYVEFDEAYLPAAALCETEPLLQLLHIVDSDIAERLSKWRSHAHTVLVPNADGDAIAQCVTALSPQVLLLIGIGGGMLLLIWFATSKSSGGSLNIKSKVVGDGQHGTARWASPKEISQTYTRVLFKVSEWRQGKEVL